MNELIQKINKLHADFESYPAGTVFDVDEMAAMIEELKELADQTAHWSLRKKKHVIMNEVVTKMDFYCSHCNARMFHNGEMINKYKYCPNCGARMEDTNV